MAITSSWLLDCQIWLICDEQLHNIRSNSYSDNGPV